MLRTVRCILYFSPNRNLAFAVTVAAIVFVVEAVAVWSLGGLSGSWTVLVGALLLLGFLVLAPAVFAIGGVATSLLLDRWRLLADFKRAIPDNPPRMHFLRRA